MIQSILSDPSVSHVDFISAGLSTERSMLEFLNSLNLFMSVKFQR